MQYTPNKTILFLPFHAFKLRNKIFLCNFQIYLFIHHFTTLQVNSLPPNQLL